MKVVEAIGGAWSDNANAWESEVVELTGDAYLEVELPQKGRLVIKKAEEVTGPYPKVLITRWGGTSFRIRIRGTTKGRFIKVCLTVTPTSIQIVNI